MQQSLFIYIPLCHPQRLALETDHPRAYLKSFSTFATERATVAGVGARGISHVALQWLSSLRATVAGVGPNGIS